VISALLSLGLTTALVGTLQNGVSPSAAATLDDEDVAHLDTFIAYGQAIAQELPSDPDAGEPDLTGLLSAGGFRLADASTHAARLRGLQAHRLANDPLTDTQISRLAGMTQSETSVGWCGRNAAIGFNDSGSFLQTLLLTTGNPSPSHSFSFTGWSQSSDAGAKFTDHGALVADPLPPGVRFRDLLGDPVVRCSDAATFYFSNIALDFVPRPGSRFFDVFAGIAVSKSTDGANTFGGAVMAARKVAFSGGPGGFVSHFLDKEWMAVQPGTGNIHVTYTDFEFRFQPADPACRFRNRVAIEHVRSTDGGATWSAPTVIDEVIMCGFGAQNFLQGSQVATGLDGDVFVAWERFRGFRPPRSIQVKRSTDSGATFPAASTPVTDVTPIGDGFRLQGNFRTFLDLQGLTVDASGGPNNGRIYITWHDGRLVNRPEPLAFSASCAAFPLRRYCFGDAFITSSTDSGASWSAPVRVNDDPATSAVDQYQPAVAVDSRGDVFVLFYDRRRDPRNFLIDTFVGRSNNGGLTFVNDRLTHTNFAPVTGWEDNLVNPFYMGDYIGVAGDATGTAPGVIVAWGDNSLGDANVKFARR
jgi:hypothetical protein